MRDGDRRSSFIHCRDRESGAKRTGLSVSDRLAVLQPTPFKIGVMYPVLYDGRTVGRSEDTVPILSTEGFKPDPSVIGPLLFVSESRSSGLLSSTGSESDHARREKGKYKKRHESLFNR